jgi:hypothetical protein
MSATMPSESPRLNAAYARRASSTFSCDTAYSESPAASSLMIRSPYGHGSVVPGYGGEIVSVGCGSV